MGRSLSGSFRIRTAGAHYNLGSRRNTWQFFSRNGCHSLYMKPTHITMLPAANCCKVVSSQRDCCPRAAACGRRGHRQTDANRSQLYESIGVTPLVNCRGTFTIVSGSQSLPEVKRAMDEASRHYVHLDELMNAVGQRLAELTQADWGIVTAGCAAALTHATSACITGGRPGKNAAHAQARRHEE